MYTKASKNGCELLSASEINSNSMLRNVRQGEGRTWLSLWPGLSLCVGQMKKLWELKLLWPHGSFGMKIDLSYLIFTRILGSNNMGGEKLCITWLHRRIIKASSSKNSESVFPCSKSWASSFVKKKQMPPAHREDWINLLSKEMLPNGGPMMSYITQYLTEKSSSKMHFRCCTCWHFNNK